jgi:hypothetical protein
MHTNLYEISFLSQELQILELWVSLYGKSIRIMLQVVFQFNIIIVFMKFLKYAFYFLCTNDS